MTHVLTLRVPAKVADAISESIWDQPGILGIQEAPLGGESIFPIAEDFEILEFGSDAAKRCAVWLERESFRRGAEILLHVYLDPPEGFDPVAFTELVRRRKPAHLEEFKSLENVDYLANYRASVQGASFGDKTKLWIGPPWAKPTEGEQAFFVEPGLAFGTGGHPTTQLCFERLVALAEAGEGERFKSVLDLGTGSGILGVAVRKYFPQAHLEVADLDPLCRDEVARTFALNGMESSLPQGWYGPEGAADQLVRAGRKFDVVVSNIYAEILAAIVPDVEHLIPEGGRWIVSGILRSRAEEQLLKAIEGRFKVLWEDSRTQTSSRLDSAGGLKAIDETWVAYELKKGG